VVLASESWQVARSHKRVRRPGRSMPFTCWMQTAMASHE
jgi:hypothetical protein